MANNKRKEIDKQLRVTPLDDLKKYSYGELVELPPFFEGAPFVARLKRPSLMAMMKSGKIPNELLITANALFTGDTSDSKIDEDYYSQALEVIEILADASFVEPTWEEIKEAGIELTDEQFIFLFNYTQKGVNAVKPSV